MSADNRPLLGITQITIIAKSEVNREGEGFRVTISEPWIHPETVIGKASDMTITDEMARLINNLLEYTILKKVGLELKDPAGVDVQSLGEVNETKGSIN